jgi:protein RecA
MLFTNQLREKIGVMFGNPETTTGGRALKFYASVRLDIRRIQSIKAGGEVVGNRTRVRVTKNKIAPPFREAEFDIMYNEGISKAGDILDIATELGVIEKRGAFFRYQGDTIGQGRENAKQFLRENPRLPCRSRISSATSTAYRRCTIRPPRASKARFSRRHSTRRSGQPAPAFWVRHRHDCRS